LNTGPSFNRIGTSGFEANNAGERNVIGANAGSAGIRLAGASQNIVAGNYIGIDVTGMVAIPNLNNGITLDSGAQNNRIGTNADGNGDDAERNVISGNTVTGVGIVTATSTGNVIAGNYIGTNAAGSAALPNNGDGVYSEVSNTTIGGN